MSGPNENVIATPGSYGEAPGGYRLPESTRLGRVVVQVSRIEPSLRFYEQVLGFRVLRRAGAMAELAAHGSDRVLIELRERCDARPSTARRKLGLYHVAILLPDRASLGRFAQHLAAVGARAGAADHLVSEAFYLSDPDDLGIEVYADRPRAAWRRVGRQLAMASDSIDMASLVAAAGPDAWGGMPVGTTIGHVHLHVGDLGAASAFYSEALGFDRVVWNYPGALFLAAGGYHHHLGTNTWAGPGATAPADDEPRLLEWTVELATAHDVEGAVASFSAHGVAVQREGTDGVVADPWGTGLRLRIGG